MRFRTAGLALAVLVLATLPAAAASAPRETPPPATVSITPEYSGITTSTTEQIMSWGNSANGTAAEVKAQVGTFGEQLAKVDATYASESVASEHQRQVKAAEAAIAQIVDAHPEGSKFSFSASGSVNQGGLGSANGGYVSINYAVTSVPEAGVTKPALGRAERATG